ncbi:hypothetical protein [Hydrogenophaga sp.]|uniref:hypothetical protein n=1 Tax=Hydrogenophaga sp. TaxID=1904254 RepID=UPI003F6B6627
MIDLAYRDTLILSTLLRELPKLSPLVRQIHPHVASLFNDRCQTQLPDKKLLQAKLHEFYLANVGEGEAE